jgi:hypothetical protein
MQSQLGKKRREGKQEVTEMSVGVKKTKRTPKRTSEENEAQNR